MSPGPVKTRPQSPGEAEGARSRTILELERLLFETAELEPEDLPMYLAAQSGEECQCGTPIYNWERLGGKCDQCRLEEPWLSKSDTCPCKKRHQEGWHLHRVEGRDGHMRVEPFERCKAWWEGGLQRARKEGLYDKKGQSRRVIWNVRPEDHMKLEAYSEPVRES